MIPYVCFVVIGAVFGVITGNITINKNIFVFAINAFFKPPYPNIYWFFIPLFTAYLCIPVISRIEKAHRKVTFGYIIVLFFVFNALLPLVCRLSGVINYNSSLAMPLGANYIFYLFLGYYIANYEIPKKIRYLIYALGVVGVATQIFGTYYLSMEAGKIVDVFKGYMGVPCILQSTAIFLYFKNVDFEKIKFVKKICEFFKSDTFGVYLVHWYVIYACMMINIPDTSIVFRTVGGVAVFIVSALIVKIMRKIPIIRNLVP